MCCVAVGLRPQNCARSLSVCRWWLRQSAGGRCVRLQVISGVGLQVVARVGLQVLSGVNLQVVTGVSLQVVAASVCMWWLVSVCCRWWLIFVCAANIPMVDRGRPSMIMHLLCSCASHSMLICSLKRVVRVCL